MAEAVVQGLKIRSMLCHEGMFSMSGMQGEGIKALGGEKGSTCYNRASGFVGDPA